MAKRIAKLLPIALTISLALTALSLAYPQAADAMISGCRGDPIIHLSNGAILHVTINVSTDVSNIKSIEYDVHVPAGVSMVKLVVTPLQGIKGKESVKIFNDAAAGQYSASAVVKTLSTAKVSWTTSLLVSGK